MLIKASDTLSVSADSCRPADGHAVQYTLQLRVCVSLAYVYIRQPQSKQQTAAMAFKSWLACTDCGHSSFILSKKNYIKDCGAH